MTIGDGGSPAFASRTIDDLQVGEALEHAKLVSLEDIAKFAEVSGDYNPVHVDVDYARASRFGTVIAHGPIALGLAGGIIGTRLPGLGTIALSASIEHLGPIRAGDVVTTRVEVAAIDHERRSVTLDLTWTGPDGECVGTGRAVVRPPRDAVAVPPPVAA